MAVTLVPVAPLLTLIGLFIFGVGMFVIYRTRNVRPTWKKPRYAPSLLIWRRTGNACCPASAVAGRRGWWRPSRAALEFSIRRPDRAPALQLGLGIFNLAAGRDDLVRRLLDVLLPALSWCWLP